MIKAKYGRIINIASMYGLVGNLICGSAPYHAAKGGVVNFTRALAAERGMTLCSEFHLRTFNDCPESARLLAEAGVGTYWQPFQTLPPEENLRIAAALGEAVRTVHVFNWAGGDRFPLADAIDDWRRYLGVLPEARTLLLEFMPDDRLETLAAESEALRRIAKGE